MKTIVCGAGNVGLSIAQYLELKGNDVTIIEQSEELVKYISDRHDIRAIHGFASDPDVLTNAGAKDADLLIAVTHSDEVNIVACEVVHALYGLPTKIARIRNRSYLSEKYSQLFTSNTLSIDIPISPELEVANAIFQTLNIPGTLRVINLAEDLRLIAVKCLSETPIINTPISHITSLFPDAILRIIAIQRSGNHFIPSEKEHLLEGDEIYFVVQQDSLAAVLAAFGHHENPSRRVIIIGGGNIGFFLGELIEKKLDNVDVRIVERNTQRANFISSKLSRSIVLHGDALDNEVLLEAGIEVAETVIAVTQDDKVNTLASLSAKRFGVNQAMALINDPGSNPFVYSLGIDSIINPREITVSHILRYIKNRYLKTVHTLNNDWAEIVETSVLENSKIIGTKAYDVEKPGSIKIAALIRDNIIILPNSQTTFMLGDKVILIAVQDVLETIEELFSARLEYF